MMNDQTLSYLQEKLAKAEAIKKEIERIDSFLDEAKKREIIADMVYCDIDFRVTKYRFNVWFDKKSCPISFSFEEFIAQKILDGAAEYRRQLQAEYEKI